MQLSRSNSDEGFTVLTRPSPSVTEAASDAGTSPAALRGRALWLCLLPDVRFHHHYRSCAAKRYVLTRYATVNTSPCTVPAIVFLGTCEWLKMVDTADPSFGLLQVSDR